MTDPVANRAMPRLAGPDRWRTGRQGRLAALLVAWALLMGCGSSESSVDAETALVNELALTFAERLPVASADVDSRCMAANFVRTLGGAVNVRDRLGVTAESLRLGEPVPALTEAEALRVADSTWECADHRSAAFAGLIEAGLAPGDRQCIEDRVEDQPIRDLLAAGFMGSAGAAVEARGAEALYEQVFAAVRRCGVER